MTVERSWPQADDRGVAEMLPADLVREAGLAVLPGQVLVREGQATYEQGRPQSQRFPRRQ